MSSKARLLYTSLAPCELGYGSALLLRASLAPRSPKGHVLRVAAQARAYCVLINGRSKQRPLTVEVDRPIFEHISKTQLPKTPGPPGTLDTNDNTKG